jgi:hypothetical protein
VATLANPATSINELNAEGTDFRDTPINALQLPPPEPQSPPSASAAPLTPPTVRGTSDTRETGQAERRRRLVRGAGLAIEQAAAVAGRLGETAAISTRAHHVVWPVALVVDPPGRETGANTVSPITAELTSTDLATAVAAVEECDALAARSLATAVHGLHGAPALQEEPPASPGDGPVQVAPRLREIEDSAVYTAIRYRHHVVAARVTVGRVADHSVLRLRVLETMERSDATAAHSRAAAAAALAMLAETLTTTEATHAAPATWTDAARATLAVLAAGGPPADRLVTFRWPAAARWRQAIADSCGAMTAELIERSVTERPERARPSWTGPHDLPVDTTYSGTDSSLDLVFDVDCAIDVVAAQNGAAERRLWHAAIPTEFTPVLAYVPRLVTASAQDELDEAAEALAHGGGTGVRDAPLPLRRSRRRR